MFGVCSCLDLSGEGPIFFDGGSKEWFPCDDLMGLRELRAIGPCVQRRWDTNSKVIYDQVCFYMLHISAKGWFDVHGGQEYSWLTLPSDSLTFWVPEILKKPTWITILCRRAPKKWHFSESQKTALRNRLQHFIADEMYNYYCCYCYEYSLVVS